MALRSNGHKFCAWLQADGWYQAMWGWKEELPNDESVEDDEVVLQKPMLKVEVKPLYYMKAPGIYSSHPSGIQINQTSVDEIAVHIWRSGQWQGGVLERSNSQTAGCIPSCNPPWTTEMKNTPRLQGFQFVYRLAVEGGGRRLTLRAEQKIVGWMMDLMAIFSRPVHLVADFGVRTLAVAILCLLLSEYRHFVGCKMDEGCVQDAVPGLVEVYARLVLSTRSDCTLNEEMCDVARVFLVEINGIKLWRKKDIWRALIGLLPVQSFPNSVFHSISSYHQGFLLFQSCPRIPLYS